jgi:hypothetical protein
MKIYILCPVTIATEETKLVLEEYARKLEILGHIVHLPHRDTNQSQSLLYICKDNYYAIKTADEVHIFFETESKGSHFDLGVAFALGKKIVVMYRGPLGPNKTFSNMIYDWEKQQENTNEENIS